MTSCLQWQSQCLSDEYSFSPGLSVGREAPGKAMVKTHCGLQFYSFDVYFTIFFFTRTYHIVGILGGS